MSALPTHITSGRDVCVVGREQRAGAPEPGRDLVEDQQQLVSVAELAQQRHDRRVVEVHAAGALHDRLEDHGRQLAAWRSNACSQLRA